MIISEKDQFTLDIDWFFTDGEHIGFVASGGGKLPSAVSASWENVTLLQEYFSAAEAISEPSVDPDLQNIVDGVDERYLADFLQMARKGLFAFDRTVLGDFSDLNYHLVASPQTPLKLNDLPLAIAEGLIKVKINGQLEKRLNLAQFER